MFVMTFLKNVEGSFLMKKFIAVLLCALFVVGLTQIPVCASDDTNKTIMHISRNAGAKGVHFYDASTGNEKYYPLRSYTVTAARSLSPPPLNSKLKKRKRLLTILSVVTQEPQYVILQVFMRALV